MTGGKSAIITALVVGLGGKASVTSRGSTIKGFIKSGKHNAEVEIHLRNRGPDAYKAGTYGDKIVVERKFTHDGSSSYKLKSREGTDSMLLKFESHEIEKKLTILNRSSSSDLFVNKCLCDVHIFVIKIF